MVLKYTLTPAVEGVTVAHMARGVGRHQVSVLLPTEGGTPRILVYNTSSVVCGGSVASLQPSDSIPSTLYVLTVKRQTERVRWAVVCRERPAFAVLVRPSSIYAPSKTDHCRNVLENCVVPAFASRNTGNIERYLRITRVAWRECPWLAHHETRLWLGGCILSVVPLEFHESREARCFDLVSAWRTAIPEGGLEPASTHTPFKRWLSAPVRLSRRSNW